MLLAQLARLEILGDVAVPLPPRSEVEEIVRILNDADSAIGEITRRAAQALERVDRIERAALNRAFRGELVPQDPTDEPASAVLERIRATHTDKPLDSRQARTASIIDPAPASAATNGHASALTEDPLDLVIAAFHQGEPRLGAATIAKATGLDAATVKRALATLVDTGQVRVHGRARGTTYEWSP